MAIILGETGRNDVCLLLGKQGEHDVTFFEFDFSLWAAEYGDGVLSLRLTPNGSATAYPVTLDFDGTIATFTVTATDTATAGLGSAELVYIVGDDEKLKKSVSYVTSVEPSDDTGEAPEPYDEWLAHLEVLAGETSQAKTDAEAARDRAELAATSAEESKQAAEQAERNAETYADRIADLTVSAHEATGETPTVIKTIVNDVYNLDFGLVPGKDGQDGTDGVGISSVALNSDYTLTITLTDGRTYTTTSIRGEQGETGLTPDFSIGTVTTLAPGSQATATITGTDEDPVLNLGIPKGDPGDVSSTGYYPELYAGGLVTDKGETDTAPYTFRASRALGYRESLNQIVGGTVAWNQLARVNVARNETSSGLTIVADGNGRVSISGTATGILNMQFGVSGAITTGHVYLPLWSDYYQPNDGAMFMVDGWNCTFRVGTAAKANANIAERKAFNIRVANSHTLDVDGYPQLIDLTAMFGSTIADYIYSLEQATAGSGIAWLRSYGFLTEDYYEYCQPRLESVRVSKHETMGRNLWHTDFTNGDTFLTKKDGELQVHADIDVATSLLLGNNSTALIGYELTPGTYTLSSYSDDFSGIYATLSDGTTWASGETKTFTSNAVINNIRCTTKQLTPGNYSLYWKLQIELGSTTTTYTEYEKHSYPLDSSLTLRGVLKLSGDEITADGDVYGYDGGVSVRYAEVDLGSLNWSYNSSDKYFYSQGLTDAIATNGSSVGIENAICSKYPVYVGSRSGIGDKMILVGTTYAGNASHSVGVRDDAYTTSASFKTAMSGVMLQYEKATPTTETADPFTQIQICDPDGTEAFTDYGVESGDRDVAIPAGHSTFYPEDLKGKLEDIPDIPEAPASNGTYTLKAVRSNTGVVYSWVSG